MIVRSYGPNFPDLCVRHLQHLRNHALACWWEWWTYWRSWPGHDQREQRSEERSAGHCRTGLGQVGLVSLRHHWSCLHGLGLEGPAMLVSVAGPRFILSEHLTTNNDIRSTRVEFVSLPRSPRLGSKECFQSGCRGQKFDKRARVREPSDIL
jgi:hypothetical protein